MALTMTTVDMAASFIISLLAGYVPGLGNNDDVMKHLDKCYRKALEKWSINQETRELMYDKMLDQLPKLVEYIKDTRKGIHPKVKELLLAWLQEIQKDSKCLEYINSCKTDFINYKVDEYYEDLKKEILQCNHEVLEALKQHTVSIEVLSERMNEIVKVQGIYPKIQISPNATSFFEMPSKCAYRQSLIADVLSMLYDKHCVWVHGNVKSGKSVFSCLVASNVDGYTKMWIPFNNSNCYDLDYIISALKPNDKYLLLLDAVDPGDSGLYEAFIQTIEQKANINLLLVVTSRKKYSDFVYRDSYMIPELSLPLLTEDDVKKMLPENKQSLLSLVFSVTYGHPWLAQIAISILESSDWQLNDDSLKKLFICPKGTPTETIVRNLVAQTVDRNDLSLLNRLLIISGDFSSDDCRAMADVKPEISNSALSLNNLCYNWVIKIGSNYRLSPLIKNALNPDLSRNEFKDCSKAYAHHILEKKVLDPSDALHVIILLIQAEEYGEAACFYCGLLIQMRDENLLDSPGLDIIKMMWVGVPLPESMNLNIQIEIRICQLTILTSQRDPHLSWVAGDLERLLKEYSGNNDLKVAGFDLLLMSNLLIGNVSESMRLLPFSKFDNVSTILDEKIDLCSLMTVSLSSVKTVEDLSLWMNKFVEKELSPWDIFNESCAFAVLNVRDNYPKDQHVCILKTIVQEAEKYGNTFLAMITTSYECLIDHYSALLDVEGVERIYAESSKYQYTDIGKLQLNFGLASAYLNLGRYDEALEAINKSTSVYDFRILRRTSLWAIVEKAAIIGRNDANGAVGAIISFVRNPYFGESFDEHEKMFIWGTLAFAYWKANNRIDSVRMMTIVAEYLWRNREEESEYVRAMLLRFNTLVAEAWEATRKGDKSNHLDYSDYNLFTKDAPHLLDDFEPLRFFGVACMMFQLADYYIKDNNTSIKLALQAMDMYKLYGNRKEDSAILMDGALPILLDNGLWNEAVYIGRMSFLNSCIFEESQKGIGQTTVLATALFFCIYRASMKLQGKPINDQIILDYIDEGKQKIKSNGVLERLIQEMSSEQPSLDDLPDDMMRIVLSVWHYEVLKPVEILNLLLRIYQIKITLYPLHSAGVFCSSFAYSIVRWSMETQSQFYRLNYQSPAKYLSRAMNYESYESYKKLIQAMYFSMKNPPELDAVSESIIYE